eukprot:11406398-Alexandrium_andersonii.AAC.1
MSSRRHPGTPRPLIGDPARLPHPAPTGSSAFRAAPEGYYQRVNSACNAFSALSTASCGPSPGGVPPPPGPPEKRNRRARA